ncbi:MAG: peptidoglycan DD-metalloendopeptidase family protein [Firmicutes bacterium]|nr:peptidoglycan DD-metalloendopeptidase family protein [Bacillota bacterium]
MQSKREMRKLARESKKLIKKTNATSHVQKKYFSLMLVPSYSTGKTRSVKIPYITFYVLLAIFLVVGAIMLTLYLRTQFLMQVAQDTAESLEQVNEAYVTLQEITEEEQRRLTEEGTNLRSALIQERIRGVEEQQQQRSTYLESLESIQEYLQGLEEQLEEFETYRQEILDRLSANAHIPAVRNMLNEMHQSQVQLLASLNDLKDYSAIRRERANSSDDFMLLAAYDEPTSEETAIINELFDHIAVIELTIEISKELYTQLDQGVRNVSLYLTNYPTIMPVRGGRISSNFGWRGREFHRGIDISAPYGSSVYATGGGTVTSAGWNSGYGYQVAINHGLGIVTTYSHNSAITVRVGQQVNRGDVIARVGSTGNSTGNHVHYEVLVNGSNVNPATFFLE